MKKINFYKNAKTPTVYSGTTADNWFSLIRESEYSDLIMSARTGQLDYDFVKLTLVPAVTYNFFYNKYKKDSNIISSTGLMYIDIDDPSFDPNCIDKNKIYAAYNSFGGLGWGLIVRIEGLTKENFKYNYKKIVSELKLEEFVDTNAIKASQYNVLSYDKNIEVNNHAYVYKAEDIKEVQSVPHPCVYKREEREAYTHGGGTVFQKPLRFNNLDDIEFEGDFTVNWEGYDWVRCWLPIQKVKSGRNKLLLSYLNNLKWLNPNLTKERALKVLSSVNLRVFESPVSNQMLQRVIDSVFKYFDEGTLKPIYNKTKRKIIFSSNSEYTAEEKREIVLDICNKKKSDDSKQKIYDIIEAWDFDNYGKISIRKISNNFPISKKTVAKYWNEFKEYINQLNK